MRSEDDAKLFQRLLGEFVPANSFDAHAHLYRGVDAIPSLPAQVANKAGNVGWKEFCRSTERWMGDRRPSGGLFFTIPKPTLDVVAANRFVADEVGKLPESRALMMIRPQDDPAAVEATLQADAFAGFKVYHVYAEREKTFEAEPGEFIPEWAWELAHRDGLAIMLHMVRARAMADPVNQKYIREHCLQYPNARLILAHAARGFCGHHTAEGIDSLRGVDNVFFDTSAICEPLAMEAILRVFGSSRLLFGTDFSVSEIRGRCVSIGDGFLWLYADSLDWSKSIFAKPTLVGLESLLALQQACRSLHLNDHDIERIFGGNARQLLGIGPKPSGAKVQAMYERAKQLIPGGTQLLSKRPEMFAPRRWPAYYHEAHGCEVVDVEGRRFLDMTSSGIGSCLLGFADPDVSAAVLRRVALGSMCTLNSADEVELAELLIQLHPWAQRARFCRTGGEVMAVAVRIARACTSRDRVAICGYHGWSDWYLAANLPTGSRGRSFAGDPLREHLLPGLAPAGVPIGLAGSVLPFGFNRLEELKSQFDRFGNELAAVVMEPTRSVDPEPGFLEGVRDLCDLHGTVLIMDEITAGWRMALGGAHLRYGVEPDLAVFAKALGNGHPMAAVIGKAQVMEAAQKSFISSTYWTESVGPAAALATIRKMQRVDVVSHVERIGAKFRDRWNELGQRAGVPVKVTGHPSLLHLGFDHPNAAPLGTLLTVRMLDRGILVGSGFYPSLAHEDRHVDQCLAAAEPVFAELAEAIGNNDLLTRLQTPVRHAGFARLT